MSFDITLIANIVSKIAPLLKNHDIEIIETHHNTKKDAPSGTSFLLADNINKSLNIPITSVIGDQQASLFGQCCPSVP